MTTGTIEEYLLQLLIEKVRLFDRVIGNSQRIIDYFTKALLGPVMEALINTENDAELSEGLPPWARDRGTPAGANGPACGFCPS